MTPEDLAAIMAELKAIREKVEWLETVVRSMGFGGPRVLPKKHGD